MSRFSRTKGYGAVNSPRLGSMSLERRRRTARMLKKKWLKKASILYLLHLFGCGHPTRKDVETNGHLGCLLRESSRDFGDAFALNRSDFGDRSASRNPCKASPSKWRKYPSLHEKRTQVRRGRQHVWHRTPALKSGKHREKSGCRRNVSDGGRGVPGGGWEFEISSSAHICYVLIDRKIAF